MATAQKPAAELLLEQIKNSKVRIPDTSSSTCRIYKDECVYCFDTPEVEEDAPPEAGLYVSLLTFVGVARQYVQLHHQKTGSTVFLHLRSIKHPVANLDSEGNPKELTKLAIGVEGGYDPNAKEYELEDKHSLLILDSNEEVEVPLPCNDLPDFVLQSVQTILKAESAAKIDLKTEAWNAGNRVESRFAKDLVQLDNGIKIPPSGWKCEKCDKTDNLWLNLTDGSILCGRRFFDGSGGNNHAVEHYEQVKYPLAVKLGTITPDGADVFSYAEDDMVLDPYLSKHLAHFGINMMEMKKTDVSMIELELEKNKKLSEWSIIEERDQKLEPLYGASFTGLANLGNSCYMNSVMQVIFSVPDFISAYYPPNNIFLQSPSREPAKDFTIQMAKLADGLLSGRYSQKPSNNREQPGIRPAMLKSVIGETHAEFATSRQQDAHEFFLHLMTLIERHSRTQQLNTSNLPVDCFKFQTEERIECLASHKLSFKTSSHSILSLPVPLEAAINKEEVEASQKSSDERGNDEKIRPKIPLSACLESYSSPEVIDDFYSSAVNEKVKASKITRLKTFPDYLVVQLKKFTLTDDWTPKKLDVEVLVPDELDISHLKSVGIQEGEELMPDTAPPTLGGGEMANSGSAPGPQVAIQIDDGVLAQLIEMGFGADSCKRAIYQTGNNGVEAAMAWIMEHMEDADFGAPFNPPTASGGNSSFKPNQEALTNIVAMGFTEQQALKALKATDNNIERAMDWIFSHPDELNSMDVDAPQEQAASSESAAIQYRDGVPHYELMAFISHMGTSTMCGHYVCHIRKDGRWVIFNDNKVAVSEKPPKEFAYLYLYRRKSLSS